MNFQRAAEIQVVLEGVALPATRADLVRYAAQHDAAAAAELERISDRAYARLDEVGEELAPTEPVPMSSEKLPKPESGEPPGGGDYLTPHPSDAGRVRPNAPRDNPPQKALEESSRLQKEQQARQEGS